MLVSQQGSAPSGISLSSARALFNDDHPFSLTSTDANATGAWCQALQGNVDTVQVLVLKSLHLRDSALLAVQNLRTRFGLSMEQTSALLAWLGESFRVSILAPAAHAEYDAEVRYYLRVRRKGATSLRPCPAALSVRAPAVCFRESLCCRSSQTLPGGFSVRCRICRLGEVSVLMV